VANGIAAARRQTRLGGLSGLIRQRGAVKLTEAARLLGVSSMTIRRDLAEGNEPLELLGGYVIARGASPGARYSLDGESASHAQAKRQAAKRAAALIEPGDTIFVDCGTTMPHLLASLPPGLETTVVCYALNIAAAASQLSAAGLFLLGGVFHPSSATFSSDEALRSLQRLGINKAFLSASGLHETRGASCSNFNEVPVKRAVLKQAERSFLVVDSSKLGLVKPAHFAPPEAFERVITEL
jgi:DeoR family transcriptional regulator, deoxyribose operon repressor